LFNPDHNQIDLAIYTNILGIHDQQ
jgi:hypothetical protein